ncbi:peptidyl-tRNA hydrolase (PTH) [Candidatus Glomeribacter gigasporarum BEG34]|uniref:Peptidyl-tRNA hydrolase n=1 Tax=Candidatus Glomeribacter gigasporarum BEG34 TaxID=1070319 RepID=G2JAI5_9BURK|nr:aminoacyl-tRNA hydrolase [Candidatus Glomeribacter gigasporarum]CCD29787.1 peptidyl-tRNA hydrolase (PTH) [Candidatus Glomeribacter gigasporarum BEG34]
MIKLIAGLGNPGGEYAATRHNAGFWVIHAIARNAGAILRPEARFHSDVAHISFCGLSLRLLQPQTFMNRSGLSVCALAQFYKILPEEILIAHDELELPPGAVKLKRGGGSGGHNGLKDITLRLSTPDYWRLRIGIGHPRASLSKEAQSKVADFVLSPPPPEEQALIHDAIRRALSVLPDIAAGNTAQAMNRLHCRA